MDETPSRERTPQVVETVQRDFLKSPEVMHTNFTGHRLLCGDFQTIKSRVVVELAWKSKYLNKRHGIILLRNYDADWHQMGHRITKINYDIIERFGASFRLPMPKKLMDLADPEIEYSIDSISGGVLLIGLCNVSTLRRLVHIIEKTPKLAKKFNLIIDEGDLFCFDLYTSEARREAYLEERSLTEGVLERLYRLSNSMHTVTATPYPVYCSQDLEGVTALSIIPPTPAHEYYSFEKLTHIPVPTQRRRGRGYHYPSDKKALDAVFRIFLTDDDARMLVNPGPFMADHDQILAYVRANHTHRGITVIIHNDMDIKVYLPSSHPKYAGGSRPYSEPSYTKPARGRDAVGIAEVLQGLKDERRDNVFTHNHMVIVAGNKAGRGISFVSEDYDWHLTHLYLVAAPTKHTEGLLQAAARLCGMYSDKPVLKLMLEPVVYKEMMRDRVWMESLAHVFKDVGASNLRELRAFYDIRTIRETHDLEQRVRLLAPGIFSLVGELSRRGLTQKRHDPQRYGALKTEKLMDRKYFHATAMSSFEEAWAIAPDAILMDGYIDLSPHLSADQKQLIVENLPYAPKDRVGDTESLDRYLRMLIAEDWQKLHAAYSQLPEPVATCWQRIRWDQHRQRKKEERGMLIRHELHLSKVRNFGNQDRGEYRVLEYFESHAFVAVGKDLDTFGLVYLLYDWKWVLANAKQRMFKWNEARTRRTGDQVRDRVNTVNRLRGPFLCHTGRGQLGLYLEPDDVARHRVNLEILVE